MKPKFTPLLLLTFLAILFVELTAQPAARYEHTLTEVNGEIFLYGGDDLSNPGKLNKTQQILGDLWKWDDGTKQWSEKTPTGTPPPSRSGHSTAVSGGKMYVFFGKGADGRLNDVWSYNPNNNSWQQESSTGDVPSGRAYHTSTTLPNGNIFVFGGETNGGGTDNNGYIYNPNTGEWQTTAPFPGMERSYLMAALVNGKVYVWGGLGSNDNNIIHIYDPSTNSWSSKTSGGNVPDSKWSAAFASDQNNWYVLGGYNNDFMETKDVYKYNFGSNEWTKMDDLSQTSAGSAAALVKNEQGQSTAILTFGGTTNGVPHNNTNEIPLTVPNSYTLITNVTPPNSGTVTLNPSNQPYAEGTTVDVTATAADGYTFRNWEGDFPQGEQNNSTINIVMNSNKSVTAVFEENVVQTYTLTTSVSPLNSGAIVLTPPGGIYNEGTTVSAEAQPAAGYKFVNWGGDFPAGEENNSQIDIVMNSNKTVTANFEVTDKYTLSVNISPPGAQGEVSVIINPDKTEYNEGETVNLTAVENGDKGWLFKEWSGDASGTNKETSVLMAGEKKAKSVTANFEEVYLTISGSRALEVVCPDTFDTYKRYQMIKITIAASEASAWNLTNLVLNTSGTGNEFNDIEMVNLFLLGEQQNTNLYDGIFTEDNGSISAAFSQEVIVPAGSSIELIVTYDFGYEPSDYAIGATKTFSIGTSSLTAIPFEYPIGRIDGGASSDDLIIARVFNNHGDPFNTIMDAINSDKTKENDICYVCKGEYNENIEINKGITLTSVKNKQETILKLVPTEKEIIGIKTDNVKIKNLTFDGSSRVAVGIGTTKETILSNANTYAGIVIENNLFKDGETSIILNRLMNSTILNNSLHRIRLTNSTNNMIERNTANTIELEYSSSNTIRRNVLTNTSALNGIQIKGLGRGWGVLHSENNTIVENTISNHSIGIKVGSSSKNKILNNHISSNITDGIELFDSRHNTIKDNYISKNLDTGIELLDSHNNYLIDNRIFEHNNVAYNVIGTGIFCLHSTGNHIIGNVLIRNCDGIRLADSKNVRISLNNIHNSLCFLTGIHLDASDAEVLGNSILDNNGNGIYLENNSLPVITANNIYGSSEYDLNNSNSDVVVDASNNYWGSENGPGQSNLFGSVDINNWFTEPVSLIAVAEVDTFYAVPGNTDSSFVFFQNLVNPNDALSIEISDDLEWLISPAAIDVTLEDTTGAAIPVMFTVPANAGENVFNKVIVEGTSNNDAELTAVDSFYISTYSPEVTSLTIYPDSSTVMTGANLQFDISAVDQYDNSIEPALQWNVSSGTIDDDQIFVAGTTTGVTTITATDPASGISAEAFVYVTDVEPILADMIINPDSAVLFPGESIRFDAIGHNQFNFPHEFDEVWNATGGTIDFSGFYVADSIPGTYNVTVSDTSGDITGEAVIIISEVTDIEEENITPQKYSLSQNYPNPFNPATTIRYSLPFTSKVKLEIYDVLGQRLEVLVNATQSAGTKTIEWNAGKFASGIYLMRIIADPVEKGKEKFSTIKKLILLK